MRLKIREENMLTLNELREEIAARNLSWAPKETRLAAVVREGGGAAFLGVRVDPALAQAQMVLASAAPPSKYQELPAPPASVDWRNKDGSNFITPIRNQGECGACVSFATCASVESRLALLEEDEDPNLDLSEAHLFFCAGRSCASGWWPEEAMDKARTQGIGLERDFRYTGDQLACKQITPAARVIGWDTAQKLKHRKQAIAFNGPVVAVFKVFEDFMYYGSGVYRHVAGDYLGLHAVAVIGYDDNEQVWLVKNSWSEQWGDRGFVRFGYGECSIDSEYVFWDPIVARHGAGAAVSVANRARTSARGRRKSARNS
jgi:C1A family cysteine protease